MKPILMNKIYTAYKNPEKILSYLTYRIFRNVRHRNFRRFIILCRSRTGSSMLLSFLNGHPSIHAEDEIFGKLNGRSYKAVLKRVFSQQPYHIKATGFKIFYYHPIDDNSSDIWNELVNMPDLYIIHLKRKNILRTLISRKIAGMQDVWSITENRTRNKAGAKTIEFSIDELERGFTQTRYWEKEGDRMFGNHHLLNVYYEDLIRDSKDVWKTITDFLNVRYYKPQTNLKKQNPEESSEIVMNYEELKSAFEGTEWEPLFE